MGITVIVGTLGYVGPGAGLSLGGALLGLLLALLTALSFTLLWPIRILYRKIRGQQPKPAKVPADRPTAEQSIS